MKKIESEKVIERTLRDSIKQKGGLALKFYSPWFTGIPDRVVLLPQGRIFFVELKSTGAKPTARQLQVHGLLQSLGFRVEVIDSKAGVIKFVEEVC